MAELNELIAKGMAALEKKNTLVALLLFDEAVAIKRTPTVLSCLGYCLAQEHRKWQKGTSLCLDAIRQDPHNALHYLNLGRIYLLAGQKQLAIQTFRKGLKTGRNPQIIQELKQLGLRRRPVFSALRREHPLNRYFGIVFARLGMR